MAQQQKQGSFKMGPPGRPAPLCTLLLFTLGMIVLPIVGFFASKRFVFEGIFDYKDGSVGGAITAVVLVHCVIAAYIYVAWKEGSTKID